MVAAADVAAADLASTPDFHPGAVMVNLAVPMTAVVAVHVDDAAAAPDVRAAAGLVHAADGGDEDATFAVDGVEDHQLQWFASQEISDVLDAQG